MGYLRGILNYLERITLSDPTHIMIMADLVAIGVETLRIDIKYSLEKEFTTRAIDLYKSVNGIIPKC